MTTDTQEKISHILPPYGYTYNHQGEIERFMPDQTRLADMRNMFKNGAGYTEIAEALNTRYDTNTWTWHTVKTCMQEADDFERRHGIERLAATAAWNQFTPAEVAHLRALKDCLSATVEYTKSAMDFIQHPQMVRQIGVGGYLLGLIETLLEGYPDGG